MKPSIEDHLGTLIGAAMSVLWLLVGVGPFVRFGVNLGGRARAYYFADVWHIIAFGVGVAAAIVAIGRVQDHWTDLRDHVGESIELRDLARSAILLIVILFGSFSVLFAGQFFR